MIALKITEIGTFINKLLKDGMCDHFLLQEAVITQAATYTIDGSFHPDYYERKNWTRCICKICPTFRFPCCGRAA